MTRPPLAHDRRRMAEGDRRVVEPRTRLDWEIDLSTAQAAAATVRRNALDDSDAEMLLEMLGITPGNEDRFLVTRD